MTFGFFMFEALPFVLAGLDAHADLTGRLASAESVAMTVIVADAAPQDKPQGAGTE